MSGDLDTWFKREVVIHDEALTRYLRRRWPYLEDIHDLRQETYARLYEAAQTHRPTAAKPFLFKIAQRLMAARIRRRRIVAIDSMEDFDVSSMLVDDISPERDTAAHQELRQLAEAIDDLPPKCREVIWMRRIDDLSQREVAARLDLSEKTVEKHVMKGMKRLIDALVGEAEDQDRRTPYETPAGGGLRKVDNSDQEEL
jgi:RNA polymerase sigma factor (sigma-70 family)